MAAFTTIDDSASKFKTLTYTGNGTGLSITGVGFAPDIGWFKVTSGGDKTALWNITTTRNYMLQLSENATVDTAIALVSFDADGYTLGTRTEVNWSGYSYINYSWLADTTTGINTTGSDITPDGYNFDQDSGVSCIEYTGNGSAGEKVPHGLGVAPEFMCVKRVTPLDTGTSGWVAYHKNMDTTAPEDYYLVPNTTASRGDDTIFWNDTAPDAVNFTVGTGTSTNASSETILAWCFTGKQGYSKFGVYESNSNADGTFVYLGFRPAFLWCKSIDGTGDWYAFDNQRLGYNVDNNSIATNVSLAQSTTDRVDLLSNGFKWRTSGALNNGNTCVYMAWAEAPFVNSNGVPGNAR